MVGFEGLWVGGGGGWVVRFKSHSSASSSFVFLSPLTKRTSSHWAAFQTTAWQQHGQEETPVKLKRGAWRGRESFGGHHCGNVVNCAFLRPWESHTRAGTCGHGKRGLRPQRGELSDAGQHHLITWCGGEPALCIGEPHRNTMTGDRRFVLILYNMFIVVLNIVMLCWPVSLSLRALTTESGEHADSTQNQPNQPVALNSGQQDNFNQRNLICLMTVKHTMK